MARYSPARDRFKVWIIDEVHQISGAAFNALLKTLEEPPPRVKFIFATTEYHKIPETILSRCQQYDFRMIATRELQRHLRNVADQEKIKVSDAALALIARSAEGSVRDALSLFDQVLAFTGDEIKDDDVAGLLGLVDRELLHRASKAVVESDSLAMLDLVESLADYGADYRNFVRELLLHVRDVLLVKLAPAESPLLHGVLPEELERLRALAGALSEEDLLRALDLLNRAEAELRNASDPRVALDLVLLKLVQMRRLLPFAEVVARVERLLGNAPAGAPPARPAVLPVALTAPRPAVSRPPAPAPPPPRPARPSPIEEPPPDPGPAPAPAHGGAAEALLATMIALCSGRPSLAAPLRSAAARLEGDTLVVEVPPDFLAFGTMHADEYRDLAKKAAGKNLQVRISPGGRPPADAPEGPSSPPPEEERLQKLRQAVEKEPAVREALDLFDGRVVDVREAKASREDA